MGLLLMSAPGAAQDFRGVATGAARYVQIRPLVRDTIPLSAVEQRANGQFFEDVPVTCVSGTQICVRYISGAVQHAVALTQDVSVTAWGLGMRGLSATLLLRGRADAGGEFDWPRSDDAFDAILGYLELDRGPWRVRLGRQRSTSGLGFAGFDGASAIISPVRQIQLEAFGGRSLARGLAEPRNEVLQGLEDFLLDRDAWLLGATAWIEPYAGGAITARYQRELWSDRSGLLSERASLDVRTPLPGPFSLSASADYDFVFKQLGKSSATLRAPLGSAQSFWLEATGRRYVPYFELWTIWGLFDPAAYHEAELRASWRATPSLSLRAAGGWRWYDNTDAEVVLSELPDEAQRASAGLVWRATPGWSLAGEYTLEKGFGAFLSSGHVSAQWQANEQFTVTLDGTAFQQIEEFRVGDGTVLGGGLGLGWDLSARLGIDAGASLYHQTFDGRPGSPDWNQARGWASLRIGFGQDAGDRRAGR
jgi:hypothetical protein